LQETAPRKTTENTVNIMCNGGVGSVVANHHDGGESSVVVTTLIIIIINIMFKSKNYSTKYCHHYHHVYVKSI